MVKRYSMLIYVSVIACSDGSLLHFEETSDQASSIPVGAFWARYYDDAALTQLKAERREEWIGFNWGRGMPSGLTSGESFGARFEGDFDFEEGEYTFTTVSDDGVRLYLDGQRILDFWTDHPVTEREVAVQVSGGRHRVGVEYYERWGEAVLEVFWYLREDQAHAVDLTAAQEFLRPLTLGVNVERTWAWERDAAFWTYLKNDVHATHVRLFYPWKPSEQRGGGGPGNAQPSAQQVDRIVDAAERAIAAGLKVFVDCTDVIDLFELQGQHAGKVETQVALCAERFAARNLDPNMVALGPVNEFAGSDNATWNPIRRDLHELMRANLPGYVLTTGAANWKGRAELFDPAKGFETFDDLRVIYEWHHYSTLNADGWKNVAQRLRDWRSANGDRPTYCGECSPGFWDDPVGNNKLQFSQWAWPQWAWPDRYAAQLVNIAAERPTLWAVTYGNSFRLNKSGSDPHLMDGSNGQPNLRGMFIQQAEVIRNQLGL
jgi:hypothetical protein